MSATPMPTAQQHQPVSPQHGGVALGGWMDGTAGGGVTGIGDLMCGHRTCEPKKAMTVDKTFIAECGQSVWFVFFLRASR